MARSHLMLLLLLVAPAGPPVAPGDDPRLRGGSELGRGRGAPAAERGTRTVWIVLKA